MVYSDGFINRFWTKVCKKDNSCCWEWRGAIQSKGYGSVGVSAGKTALAHRVAYELTYGEIPKGMHVLHKCDNRRCVNPAHIFLGTNKDNVRDKVQKGRQAKGEKNGRSKLTYKQIDAIRYMHKTGRYSSGQIAELFGVCPSNVRNIVRGDYWKLPLAE